MLKWIGAERRHEQPATHPLFDVVSMDCRVRLIDIDRNLQLGTGTYTKIMDRCRREHGRLTGLLGHIANARINVVLANTEIAYVRELRPYQRFQVHTRVLGWDDKYLYYDQRFDSQNKLHTHALHRLACLHGGKTVSTSALQEALGHTRPSPPLPEYVESWKTLLHNKRRLTERH